MSCSGDEHAPKPPKWHAGASFGVLATELGFNDGLSAGMQRRAVSASLEYRLTPADTLGLGAGAGLGGVLRTTSARRFDITPGWLVTASYSRRFLDGRGRRPFLLLSASLGASGASTREEVPLPPAPALVGLYAFDLRIGLTVGKTFFDVLSPYAALRAFGGPVIWSHAGKTVVGSDDYHVQLGAGLVTALPRGVDVFAEIAPLGERAVTLGVGKSF